jgi:hypothetical protein
VAVASRLLGLCFPRWDAKPWRLLVRLQQFFESIACWKPIARMMEEWMALVQHCAHRYEEGVSRMQEALEGFRRSPGDSVQWGLAALEAMATRSSRFSCPRSLPSDPKTIKAMGSLAIALQRSGQFEQGRALVHRVIEREGRLDASERSRTPRMRKIISARMTQSTSTAGKATIKRVVSPR